LENSKQELSQTIEDKKAIIKSKELPTSHVIPFQIQQLFTNLLNNSLKYSKKTLDPKLPLNMKSLVQVQKNNFR